MLCECGCAKETSKERRFLRNHQYRVLTQPPGTKWCPQCESFHPLDSFYGPSERKYDWCVPCVAKDRRRRYETNAEAMKQYSKVATKRRNVELRLKALTAYGLKCRCCGEAEIKFLVIDHINGGGSAHRKSLGISSGGGSTFYLWLEKNNYPRGFRTLCHNCNMASSLYGRCPHRTRKIRRIKT